ncbi:MAG: EutN/CcmL family microcompartment protein [Fimbriimonadaceae bacterium]|nr:EutN/CcmL family microcompartment protein [Fimbriimonadaceae bacterium]
MQLGKVIGRVRAEVQDRKLRGLPLKVIVPLNEQLETAGEPLVAADPLGSAMGQVVYWESSLEARMAAPDPLTALDAAIVGFVDHLGSQCSSAE